MKQVLCLIGSASTSSLPGLGDHVAFWYKLFGSIPGRTNFFAWALSVMFLVFTLRALYKPFVRQIRTTRQMQELQPQIKELAEEVRQDRQRMAPEMQKLQSDTGSTRPRLSADMLACQIPVFLGLYHVLRSFNGTRGASGQHRLTADEQKAIDRQLFLQCHRRTELPGSTLVRCTDRCFHDTRPGPRRFRVFASRRSSRSGCR